MSRDWESRLCWETPEKESRGAVRFELKPETGMLCDPGNVSATEQSFCSTNSSVSIKVTLKSNSDLKCTLLVFPSKKVSPIN